MKTGLKRRRKESNRITVKMNETVCPVCGTVFYPPSDEWGYTALIGNVRKKVCSYHCSRKIEAARMEKYYSTPEGMRLKYELEGKDYTAEKRCVVGGFDSRLKKSGYTMKDIAARLGLQEHTVYLWRSTAYSPEKVARMEKALDALMEEKKNAENSIQHMERAH